MLSMSVYQKWTKTFSPHIHVNSYFQMLYHILCGIQLRVIQKLPLASLTDEFYTAY